MKKCKGAEPLAILEFNNTPTEGLELSPAEILFGRKCRTRMIIQKENLIPRHDLKGMEKKREIKLRKQKTYYDRNTKNKNKIQEENDIIMRKPGEKTWTRGECLNEERNRSIQVEVDGRIYTRNRIDLKVVKKENKENEKSKDIDQETEVRRSGRIIKLPERFR